MGDSLPNQLISERNITQFLLEKAAAIIYLLRIAAANKDYVHDEIARCGDTGCLKQALYKLVRRYGTPDGLKTALRSISSSGIAKIPPEGSGCGDIEEYAKALHQRIVHELANPTLRRDRGERAQPSPEKGIEAFLVEVEGALATDAGRGGKDTKFFKDIVTTLALLGLAPGLLPYVRCEGGEK